MAMVFQNYALYPHMTVRREHRLLASCEAGKRPRSRAKVEEAAHILGLTEHLDASPRSSPAGSASASRWAARSCASRRRS